MSPRRIVDRFAFYPVLLAVAFLIKPFTTWNISPVDAGRSLAVGVGLAVILTIACSKVLGRDRGGAVAALVVMALAVATTGQTALAVVLAIGLLLVEAVMASTGRLTIKIPWARITEGLTVIVAVLLGIEIAMAAQLRHEPTYAASPAWQVTPSGPRPNIYVILADGHGRTDVLENAYGLDMAPLRTSLEALGFEEAPRSEANHLRTLWSLSVLLNGRPLAELGQDMSTAADLTVPPAAIRRNAVFALAERAGYKTVAIDSGFAELHLESADSLVDVGPINEYEDALLSQTAVGQLLNRRRDATYSLFADRVLRQVDALTSLAATPTEQPRLVFAHLPSPHMPYVFDAECRIDPGIFAAVGNLPTGPSVAPERLAAERDQTVCVDSLLTRVATTIVDKDPDAVVVLLSDHGPEDRLDWEAPSEPGLRDRFANFFWARTPGIADPFPDDITLVNIFPTLFNALWDTELPTHPNDLYVGPTFSQAGFTPYVPSRDPADMGVSAP